MILFSLILTTVKAGAEQHHLHKKMLVAIVAATTSLAALVFGFLCFWIYHTRCPIKSKTKRVKTPGPGACLFCNVPFLVYLFKKNSELNGPYGIV